MRRHSSPSLATGPSVSPCSRTDDLGSCASFGRGASGWKLGCMAVSVWISMLAPLEEVVRELLVLVLVALPRLLKLGDPELPD